VAAQWDAYGPGAWPALEEVLQSAQDRDMLVSACWLVAMAQHLPALPAVRALVKSRDAEIRGNALVALGLFGHPDDYPLLLSGLTVQDPAEPWYAVSALALFGDLRAVPRIVPFLADPDVKTREDALLALFELPTPEGLDALIPVVEALPGDDHGLFFEGQLTEILGDLGSSPDGWKALSREEKERRLAARRAASEAEFALRPGERTLSHEDFVKAAAEWTARRRISGGEFEWVEDRHVLAAATAVDLGLLLRVRGVVYGRLSDECLYEVNTLNRLITRLGRSRFRAEPGVCKEVKQPTPEGR
jgi:hypothetical protein